MSSGPDKRASRRPTLLFAAVDLTAGSGGIAELSRQTFKVLLEMHEAGRISLTVRVLEGHRPATGDPLFPDNGFSDIRWHGGKRWNFTLGVLVAAPDLLLFDHLGLARGMASLPRPLARRYLALIHGVEIWNSGRLDYLHAAQRAMALIANSNYTAQKARTHCRDLPEIRVCWPGKDLPADTKPALAEPAGIGPHAILIVGRLSAAQRHKGHDLLLEAMPLILKAIPDARLVIAGTGDDRERLECKARQLGVADQVMFTGWVEENRLSALYAHCALFVMPSVGDGFGLVFLEAMMHKLPCVGLENGSAAEIFEQGTSGVLVKPGDTVGLARTLIDLLGDPARRRQLGEAGFKRYQSAFQGHHYSRRLQTVLADCLVCD